ncbi:hypothetical protein AQUCO_00300729v1 [Aquilegia coerulea]|uniref:F-box domain-containing protein n=1 Tax=Aquilegia coerulea TaxID=218851 RepID=A0A2G5F059_AQUCA|nr:hypothetical protein AQUCO_00300729v1 [Aquilegia coerulea]
MSETTIFSLTDDLVLKVLSNLEDDPRYWACVACVSTKFSSLVRNICWKNKCSETIPSIVSDLISFSSSDPPAGWSSLYKVSVCCPGLHHAGILLENSDFGLERELGPDENYQEMGTSINVPIPSTSCQDSNFIPSSDHSEPSWSLYDDLYMDTVYDVSESSQNEPVSTEEELDGVVIKVGSALTISNKKRKKCRSIGPHLASGVWNLSREQGNKLLASRFRGDCLYICDWPGCVHTEEKRNYMIFRGIFKNFKKSQVWRTINDGNRSKIMLDCAFCSCKETWDLHSAFCLRRVFGYHDDGEPVVRAYVCENGHVSGAWTERPMYS